MSAGDATRSRGLITFGIMAAGLVIVGLSQSWSVSLSIVQLCLISSIMALGVNIQWGYAGLFNVGIMGFAALGVIAGVLVSKAPVPAAWEAGGTGIFLALGVVVATIIIAVFAHRRLPRGPARIVGMTLIVGICYFAARAFFDPAVDAIESVDPAKTGYLGGLGMPIIFSWAVGGVFAAGAAFVTPPAVADNTVLRQRGLNAKATPSRTEATFPAGGDATRSVTESSPRTWTPWCDQELMVPDSTRRGPMT